MLHAKQQKLAGDSQILFLAIRPRGTPPAIIEKLNAAARTAVESEPVKKRFYDLSTVAPDASEHAPDVLGQLVTRDVEKYRKLLEEKK